MAWQKCYYPSSEHTCTIILRYMDVRGCEWVGMDVVYTTIDAKLTPKYVNNERWDDFTVPIVKDNAPSAS